MIERTPKLDLFCHLLLIAGVVAVCLPLYYALIAATHTLPDVLQVPMPLTPGNELLANLETAMARGDLGRQLLNSLIVSVGVTVGKISVSILSAFAITYFRFPFRMTAFWLIFATLMLPIEVRIVPTYAVAAHPLQGLGWLLDETGLRGPLESLTGWNIEAVVKWSLLDSYAGLILPLMASATATFLFRQLFLTIPEELLEAAKIDGASPMRFLIDVLWPMSRTNVVALTVILFVFGWNQYLWPLLITTEASMTTAVIGLSKQISAAPEAVPKWNTLMASALVITLPPVMVVIVLQRWFVKGLVDSEK
ncbi:ABC transporter permease subunit [Reyranella sp.]|uniref:ABC transporter permease subunit n=1 Tax=Reyranella sp. TaxID=1929291 RepID=UPI0040361AF2